MRILICDDTKSDLEVTYSLTSEYFKKQNINAKIDTFTDSNIVLNSLEFLDVNYYDLYLLDVVMQQNGIDVAKEILRKVPNASIIFTTTSREFAIDAFKVQAFDYILKPIKKDELFDSISRVLKTLNIKKTTWKIKTSDLTIVNISLDDIVYIESTNRRIEIHLTNNEVITTTSLRTKFVESIPFNLKDYFFILSHSSYIVNLNKIKGIKDLAFIMENGEIVPISKRMLKEVKEQYINYLVGDTNEIR